MHAITDHAGRNRPGRRTVLLAAGALALLLPQMALAEPVKALAVTVPTVDGQADAALFVPEGKGPFPAVILWHDLSGLRPAFDDMGKKLAAQGFVVLAPNAFYRSAKATGATVDLGNAEMRQRQMGYRAAASDDGVARDAIAYVLYLDALPQTAKGGKIGTLGYDVGGSYAFRAAAALPGRIAAVASIHGLGVATPRPNSPHLLVPHSTATYYVVQSKDDDAREPGDKGDYEAVLAEGKLEGVVDVSSANHGFAVPDSAAYDAGEASRTWGEIVALFKAKLN